jgi:hypothetical protein
MRDSSLPLRMTFVDVRRLRHSLDAGEKRGGGFGVASLQFAVSMT